MNQKQNELKENYTKMLAKLLKARGCFFYLKAARENEYREIKSKRPGKRYHANANQMKARVTLLTVDKVDFITGILPGIF